MFISFEGGDGSGKTTLSQILFQKMSKKFPVILTKEPGGGNLFNIRMREILINFFDKIDSHTEALLYAADRTEHLKKVILPALKDNKIVICDRYLDSSFAYQGYGRGLDENFIKKINFLSLQHLPQITFYLDLDPNIGIQRLKNTRKNKIEYFDLKQITFHQKVREGFLKLCDEYPERIHKLDASASVETLVSIIENKIEKLFRIKI
ncbi:dTMP kinase ['Camptotheca acuminata' phytoplasma]|uniref:dTMP kinase n=1 Tax='Camptotheca acuminata' phytoplasma TaxID=3239192 RepID=UPI00351A0357